MYIRKAKQSVTLLIGFTFSFGIFETVCTAAAGESVDVADFERYTLPPQGKISVDFADFERYTLPPQGKISALSNSWYEAGC